VLDEGLLDIAAVEEAQGGVIAGVQGRREVKGRLAGTPLRKGKDSRSRHAPANCEDVLGERMALYRSHARGEVLLDGGGERRARPQIPELELAVVAACQTMRSFS
jgi:hypothetical protein